MIKNLLHLFITNTGGVGELSNFILGAAFVGVAGLYYKKDHTRKGALLGSLVGALVMAVISVFTNYFIVYPFYAKLFLPMPAIVGAYQAILPAANNLWKALIIFNLPFNFVKGVIDAALVFIVYKRITPILKKK